MKRLLAGVMVASFVLGACSGGGGIDKPPTAQQLVKRLTVADVCSKAFQISPGSESWACRFPPAPAAKPDTNSYVAVTAYSSPAKLARQLSHLLVCPSEVSIEFVRGPAWLAKVVPTTRGNATAVIKTIGGRRFTVGCGIG